MLRERERDVTRLVVGLLALLVATSAGARASAQESAQMASHEPMLRARSLEPTASVKIFDPAGSVRVVAWDHDSIVVRGRAPPSERMLFAGLGGRGGGRRRRGGSGLGRAAGDQQDHDQERCEAVHWGRSRLRRRRSRPRDSGTASRSHGPASFAGTSQIRFGGSVAGPHSQRVRAPRRRCSVVWRL